MSGECCMQVTFQHSHRQTRMGSLSKTILPKKRFGWCFCHLICRCCCYCSCPCCGCCGCCPLSRPLPLLPPAAVATAHPPAHAAPVAAPVAALCCCPSCCCLCCLQRDLDASHQDFSVLSLTMMPLLPLLLLPPPAPAPLPSLLPLLCCWCSMLLLLQLQLTVQMHIRRHKIASLVDFWSVKVADKKLPTREIAPIALCFDPAPIQVGKNGAIIAASVGKWGGSFNGI